MSTIEEIKTAVSKLPPEELSSFRAWFSEFDADAWDHQFEQDVAKGLLAPCLSLQVLVQERL